MSIATLSRLRASSPFLSGQSRYFVRYMDQVGARRRIGPPNETGLDDPPNSHLDSVMSDKLGGSPLPGRRLMSPGVIWRHDPENQTLEAGAPCRWFLSTRCSAMPSASAMRWDRSTWSAWR